MGSAVGQRILEAGRNSPAFIQGFTADLARALDVRQQRATPETGVLIAIIVSLVLAYIAASMLLIGSDTTLHFHLMDEKGSITALSALFLGCASGFAFVSFWISPDSSRRDQALWLILGLGLCFLAFDELLMFHERIGNKLDGAAGFKDVVAGTSVRNWNDLIVISYGLIALPFAAYFLPSLLCYPKAFEYLCLAVVFYLAHTAIDSVVEPPTSLSMIVEESCKLFCSTFLAIGVLTGLLGQIGRFTPPADDAA